MTSDFHSLPVLLTGATGAIGTHIARRLAAKGYNLILGCRNASKGEDLRRTIASEFPGIEVSTLIFDMADRKSIRKAEMLLGDRNLRGLINNAGVMQRNFTLSPSGGEMTLDVNYRNTRLLTELLIPHLVPGSAIVFTTSLTRFAGRKLTGEPTDPTAEKFSQLGTYALSKRALTRYGILLADAVEKRGIRVNLADPGVVNTGMITMQRWFDPLANILFRPFIRRPSHGAIPAVRAFLSQRTATVFCRFLTHKR